jgi:hypothetical protein
MKYVSNNFWNDILERIEKKLIGWKGKTLSSVGKLQLLISSLQGLLVYFLSLFKITDYMANKLQKVQPNFLWSRGSEKIRKTYCFYSLVGHPNDGSLLVIRNIDAKNCTQSNSRKTLEYNQWIVEIKCQQD